MNEVIHYPNLAGGYCPCCGTAGHMHSQCGQACSHQSDGPRFSTVRANCPDCLAVPFLVYNVDD